jgi:glycosyltransferase involved in cell wall biosynthesis
MQRTQPEPAMSRPRLAIVVSHPIQHFCPLYRAMAAEGRVELLVIFAERGADAVFNRDFGRVIQWQANILEGFESSVVTAPESERPEAVVSQLRSFQPDAVFSLGYHSAYHRAALRWARKSGISTLMTTDSELLHKRPLHVRLIKKLTLPAALRDVDLFLTVGDENERYFEHYGADRARFHRVPFSIDSPYYDGMVVKRAAVRESLRRELQIGPHDVVILTAGKLIPRKRQADLVAAFARVVRDGRRSAVLLIAGDGPDRTQIEKMAAEVGPAVRLLGFIGVDRLPEYYLASDIYVHPSDRDPHPLAISEAAYCGLPIVVSDRIGSRGPSDDVQVGRNGWVYPVGDIAALAKILGDLIDEPDVRRAAGAISQELGRLHAVDACATRFIDGVLRSLAEGKVNAERRRAPAA